jgi:hypothetical protein
MSRRDRPTASRQKGGHLIRSRSETGWWLITHVDHAHLAAAFAERWGNDIFLPPEPRAQVLMGIAVHDDGWAARDEHPQITREGRPSAFSSELVGKYSAFEEIDLEDYLAVRDRALRLIAQVDPYAAILVSMHTWDLLTNRADRASIAAEKLSLLDAFLAGQEHLQHDLHAAVVAAPGFKAEEVRGSRIEEHFRLLQACDNLSLLSCVDYRKGSNLLHPLPLRSGHSQTINVEILAERHFRLDPYPLDAWPLTLEFPARHVEGATFASAEKLQEQYAASTAIMLPVTITA